MPTAKGKKKPAFTRCPHCHLRYGSEESLTSHVNEHRVKYVNEILHPEHRQLLHPARHAEELKSILKRGGHR